MKLEALQSIVDQGNVIAIVARYPRDARTTVTYQVRQASRAFEIIGTLRRCGLKPNVYSVPLTSPPSAPDLPPLLPEALP
jgi:hypothetical protein